MVVGIAITIPSALGEALLCIEALVIREGCPNNMMVVVLYREEAFYKSVFPSLIYSPKFKENFPKNMTVVVFFKE